MPTLNWIRKDKIISHDQDVPYRILNLKHSFTADAEKGTDKEKQKES